MFFKSKSRVAIIYHMFCIVKLLIKMFFKNIF